MLFRSIEVTPVGDRFVVRIAFRMSALHPNEVGTITRHTRIEDLRRDIEETTGYVIRDLFDFCSSRGIERLSVSCNRAITERDENGKDRLMMRSLFRASIDAATAAKVASWRSLSTAQVISLAKVEYDILSKIVLSNLSDAPVALDPNQPLEF